MEKTNTKQHLMWVFHHLPKTAGSSLVEALQSQLRPYENVFVRGEDLGHGKTYGELLDLAFFQFAQRTETECFAFVSGHFFRRHIVWFAEHSGVRLFTFLREPLAKLVSEYRYQQTPEHPGHLQFKERYPTFDHFLSDPDRQNMMCFAISGTHDAAKSMAIIRREYYLAATLEDYEQSTEVLFRQMGLSAPNVGRVNVTASMVPHEVEEPERYRAEFSALNSADVELYAQIRDLLPQRLREIEQEPPGH